MSSMEARLAVPGLFPDPREVVLTGGETDLSQDVRLATNNVLPLQRKAMRGILTEAGVRVVANKKKYVIEATVAPEDAFELGDVPEAARPEYYELELRGSLVFIRTPGQSGALWATQTLGAIFRAFANGCRPPNLRIRDWPALPNRGIFVESKWGPDRMVLPDWCTLIDRLSTLKLNRLGIGLYGCWGNCRFEGAPTEFLQVPVPGHEDLRKEHRLTWYSPARKEWCEETYEAPMFRDNFLAEVVNYGREKGVTVIPFVNSLGHNTLIPRLLPRVSAKDADGSPRGVGYSIADPATREFIEGFYGSIIERFFPAGIDFFHIQMDEVWPDYPDPDDPHRTASPWCEAPVSTARGREENLRDYILWLVRMLTDKGVGKVVMWNDQLTRHMDILDDAFLRALEEAGLKDRLILHWWWYSNDALNDKTHVRLGAEKGIEGWVAPMTCYFNWSRYDYRRPNIARMLEMAFAEGATGAVSYAVHDPGHTDHEALLASCAWSGMDPGGIAAVQERWAACFGAGRNAFLAAAEDVVQAATAFPTLASCWHYTYTYCGKDLPWPRPYPGEALERLCKLEGVDAAAQLAACAATAARAQESLAGVAQAEDLESTAKACALSLAADAARIRAVARTFAFLVALRQGTLPAAAAAECAAATETLLAAMAVVEKGKPDWVAPACLQSLSVLLRFLEQLAGDIRAGGELRWTVA
ncbi:MAG: family 20 glycosylhydrolase [Lentisphaeria bacterium]|nr:family 20 glycosylhydrolase [Lentisphaeria bacterium]